MAEDRAHDSRRVPNVDPKNFNDPAEYQEAIEAAQGNAPAAEPDSPRMTAALHKAKSPATRANIRDILG
jgi:hypothetical protein